MAVGVVCAVLQTTKQCTDQPDIYASLFASATEPTGSGTAERSFSNVMVTQPFLLELHEEFCLFDLYIGYQIGATSNPGNPLYLKQFLRL